MEILMDYGSLVNYFEILVRRKWAFLAPLLVCTVLGLVAAYSIPANYRSSTLILVEQQQVPEEYVTPTNKVPFGQKLNTIRQQIMSRSKLEQIITDFNLYRENGGGLLSGLLGKAGIPAGPAGSKEEALERLSRDIEIRVIGDNQGNGDAFSISYIGTDPYVAMQVTNKLASLFIEESLKTREQYAEGTSDFLEEELANAKQELEKQERAVRQFKERYMGSLPQQLEPNLRTLDRIQLDLQAVRSDLRNAEENKAIIEKQLVETKDSVAEVHPLEAELQTLEKDLAALLSTYSENYPDVVLARNRISEVKALISKQKAGPAGRPDRRTQELNERLLMVNAQISSLRQRESDLKSQIRSIERKVEDTPANEQRFLDLRRDYDISLTNYQGLLEKKLNARLAENLEKRQKGERFKVLDSANLPEKPYGMNRLKVMGGGAFAGAAMGIGLIFVLEMLNPAFRKPEEFDGIVAIPVIATIPLLHDEGNSSRKRSGRFRILQGRKAGKWES